MTPSLSRQSDFARLSRVLPACLAALLWVVANAAQAQPVPSASPAASALTPLERAKRDAEKVYLRIRMHSDKPRRASPPPAGNESPAAAAPVAAKKVQAQAAAKPSAVDSAATPPVPAEKAMLTAKTSASQSAPVVAPPVEPAAPIVEENVTLVALLQVEPEFPNNLMRKLRKGSVQVAFTVQPDGSVTQAHSLESTHPRLVQIAVATVSKWRFQPIHRAQQAMVELGFDLDMN